MFKRLKKIILSKNFYILLLIAFLILISAFFRFYNLNWDQGNFYHPDERNIANAVTKIRFFSRLDPQFFAYGGFSIYLYTGAVNIISFITKDSSWISDWGLINVVARFFSALFSTLTIIPLYFLAKKIASTKTALIAVILYTFTVTSIQTSHYGVTESVITFIGVLICLFSIINFKKLNLANTIILGVISGIGIAAKISSVLFLIMPFSSFILMINKNDLKLRKIAFYFLLFSIICFLVFTLFSPFTFINWSKFLESMNYESGVATGSLPVVYTLQFDNTLRYIFQIKNLFWQIGLAALFSVLGFIFLLYKALKTKNKEILIFILFPLIYFLYVGAWHTKFLRYMVPIVPFLIILAGILLAEIRLKYKIFGKILIMIVILSSVFWSVAFFSIYTRPQTRIAASRWIYSNIPRGSKILGEQWDDGLPNPIGQFNPSVYQITQLAMYDTDNEEKINYLSSNLSNSDYIIFNSRRLYGTLIYLVDEYPITSRYYKLLFSGKLGYVKVAEFTSYPSILGLTINDDSSEETFQVYEHPKVLIFKNEDHLSQEQLKEILKNGKIL